MSIIRVSKDKNNPYFVMNKSGIDDPNLSLKAKGLLSYLISKPDGWYINYKNIIKHCLNSVYSVRSAVAELLSQGYMERTQIRKNNGQFGYYDYIVYEKPLLINTRKNRLSPHSGFPHTVEPHTVNHTLLSNDIKNIMSTTTTPSPKNLKLPAPAAVHIASLNKKEDAILLFDKLSIKNYKKIFKEFPIDKILDYCTWTINRKSKMSNPTGFLICSMRENWLDYEPKNSHPETRIYFALCPDCGYECGYERIPGTPINCRKCKKLIPKKLYEKI
ncbi:hypothetical protein ES703_14876 [subsurface metagenome]